MSRARREWRVAPNGDLTLRLEVDVNGKTLAVATTLLDYKYGGYGLTPPFRYVEREMRSRLMRALEDELLGPLQ